MLSLKLQEMDELEEEDTISTDNNVDGFDADRGNISVNEEEEEEEATEDEEGYPEEEEENPEDEEQEEEEEDLDPDDPDFADKLKDLIRDIVSKEVGENESEEEELPAPEVGIEGTEDGNQIDIDELLAELNEMDSEEDPLEEGLKDEFNALRAKYGKAFEKMIDTVGNAKPIAPGFDKAIDRASNVVRKVADTNFSGGKGAQMREDLQEALAAVETLRNQLQEVNLLNAKLLYVNKVFKSNNLTESQKVNVIATFDKAETVREVKLVFETVSKNVVTKKPTAIKEHLSFASKATGNAQTTAPKEIISEVSDQVKRMQFLAGIKTN